jgi:hypothetical protein
MDRSIVFDHEQMVRLDKGTFHWVSLKQFRIDPTQSNRRLLDALVAHEQYRDHYAGGRAVDQNYHSLHGPYRLEYISVDTFRPVRPTVAQAVLQEWVKAASNGLPSPQVQQDLNQNVYSVLDADSLLQLPNLRPDAEHDWGWYPTGRGPVYVRADSNGNAAGTTLEDAVLQGMLEVVERDAVTIWWYNQTRAPGVDLDAFTDPWLTELRDVYAGLTREVWVLDVTSDLDIPVMAAVSRRTDRPREDIMLGFGAHLDPAIALRRALTELNQLVPAVLEQSTWDDPDAHRWWDHATVANQPYLIPDPMLPQREPADYSYRYTPDLADDIASVHTRLAAAGLEVLVLDQTRPDIGLPVAKVIVPGLRSFWARFAPGRLYDVPVRLGRLATPKAYENLNPFPLFV